MKKVFNWSEMHLSEVTSYKIYILVQALEKQKGYVGLVLARTFRLFVSFILLEIAFFVVVSALQYLF